MLLVLLNHDGDNENYSKTACFFSAAGLEDKGVPNLVNGCYIGEDQKWAERNQFHQCYIPHLTVLDARGTIMGNRVPYKGDNSAFVLAKSLVGTVEPLSWPEDFTEPEEKKEEAGEQPEEKKGEAGEQPEEKAAAGEEQVQQQVK